MTLQVRNFTSPRSGQEVANQFIITTNEGQYFQSYTSIIAFIPLNGNVQLDKKYWNYSKTTIKYRNEFLRMNTREIEQAINGGAIILADLN